MNPGGEGSMVATLIGFIRSKSKLNFANLNGPPNKHDLAQSPILKSNLLKLEKSPNELKPTTQIVM